MKYSEWVATWDRVVETWSHSGESQNISPEVAFPVEIKTELSTIFVKFDSPTELAASLWLNHNSYTLVPAEARKEPLEPGYNS